MSDVSKNSEKKSHKAKRKRPLKAVYVDLETFGILKDIREYFAEKFGIRGSMNMVVRDLISKASQTNTVNSSNYFKQERSLSPPPVTRYRKKILKTKKLPKTKKTNNTTRLKIKFINEINNIFTGKILKPSDVAGLTNENHKLEKELNIDCEIPSIEQISIAKKFKATA